MVVYGEDNGECSIYDLTLQEYKALRYKISVAENNADDALVDKLEEELFASRMPIDVAEEGYVPDYVVKLAEIYGFEVDSI